MYVQMPTRVLACKMREKQIFADCKNVFKFLTLFSVSLKVETTLLLSSHQLKARVSFSDFSLAFVCSSVNFSQFPFLLDTNWVNQTQHKASIGEQGFKSVILNIPIIRDFHLSKIVEKLLTVSKSLLKFSKTIFPENTISFLEAS